MPLIVTLSVSATIFEIFRLKDLLILPTPPLFDAPAGGNPLECRDELWCQKTRIMRLPDGEEIMTGQTDGRTDTLLQRPALA